MQTAFENGAIYINSARLGADADYRRHPTFSGVYIKSLIAYDKSERRLNAMLVKIDPRCEIGDHLHDKEYELHQIIGGEAEAIIDGKSVAYKAGVVSLIAPNVKHSVKALEAGAVLLAVFTPNLTRL
ncbi:MAG: cupin domain-containing protein [Helicobacteraceae bacterium]|jgi:quercetin dioxygenase-like cupin family protein|nr:cupin domain-containing protein [Helicobacteraceae bacterium]